MFVSLNISERLKSLLLNDRGGENFRNLLISAEAKHQSSQHSKSTTPPTETVSGSFKILRKWKKQGFCGGAHTTRSHEVSSRDHGHNVSFVSSLITIATITSSTSITYQQIGSWSRPSQKSFERGSESSKERQIDVFSAMK